MTKQQVALIGGVLAAFGAIVATAGTWNEVLRPGFIGPALVAIGAVVKGIYTERPER